MLVFCLAAALIALPLLLACGRRRRAKEATSSTDEPPPSSSDLPLGDFCCAILAARSAGRSPGDSKEAAGESAALRPAARRRSTLPHAQIDGGGISMWDLARRSLPIHALTEELRFAGRFLDELAEREDAAERLLAVVGFVLSGAAGVGGRRRKPFNPLLGETFDFVADDRWKYHAEQVSHHPPVSACHADGAGWTWWQTFDGRLQHSLDSTRISAELPTRLRLADGSVFAWTKPATVVENARAAAHRRRVRLEGEVVIASNTGVEARLLFAADGNRVEGAVRRPSDGEVVCRLDGRWDERGNREVLFEAPEPHEDAARFYGFSEFTFDLNHMHAAQRPFLPPTDSRLRPDQRLLEDGETKRAADEKKRLEHEQRERAHRPHTPVWFRRSTDEFTGRSLWTSNGRYWTAKERKFEDEHSRAMLPLFRTVDE
ncbi:Oxysterol-binding protein-related protein 3 [Aphelenchoides fujianensis]|nr:Oxysterol-binding protein-related protein 3 [Aphelenchoides fujianensis]KAI6238796.1 Oxysterol-binding protein-related protein 3 [Aphelenchoides fujianensis]